MKNESTTENTENVRRGGRHDHHHKHHDDHGHHGHHHHGPHGGPRAACSDGGGRRGGRARRGESKYLLMDALQTGPKHGYELIKSLEERAGGRYAPSPGVVYPTLQFLAEAGLVRAEQDGDRRVFHLTDNGAAELAAHTEEVAAFWAQLAPPTDAAARAEIQFVEEELESLIRTVRGGLRGNPNAELVRGVRQRIEACRNEVRAIIANASPETEAKTENGN